MLLIPNGAGIAQLVERPTEKSSVRRGKFLPESTSSADSDVLRTAVVCNRMHQHQGAHPKIPNTSRHTVVWTHGNTAHSDRNG